MDRLAEIQQRIKPELERMNSVIRRFLTSDNDLMDNVVGNYLQTKGKQIRPIMVILSAKFFGEVNPHVIHAGAALEMLHNASLIHDDVVDDTALRRGHATVNNQWGNHIAVLVGDFFVANALAAGISTGNLSIISSLSDLGKELSLGEVEQICNVRDHHLDEAHYFSMIRKKTACLFSKCVKMGAEAVGTPEAEYQPLAEYAELLGMCFQIRDDIFDYFSNPLIGKPTGNDLREGKVTLPLLHAIQTAPGPISQSVKEMLLKGDLNEKEIGILIDFAKEYHGIEYAFDKMREMQQRAYKILDAYPDSEWKETFRDLFEYIISRDK
ncbi:MAG: polyprenyl synthetase family protein [Muribaculaceae bacterium]|nr:polyprenyl synthetase family protein [Muribaculaceae bacterium]